MQHQNSNKQNKDNLRFSLLAIDCSHKHVCILEINFKFKSLRVVKNLDETFNKIFLLDENRSIVIDLKYKN